MGMGEERGGGKGMGMGLAGVRDYSGKGWVVVGWGLVV